MALFNAAWKKWHLTKMSHGKYSAWNRQIWHTQKMVSYKNDTPCEKMPKGYICQGLS